MTQRLLTFIIIQWLFGISLLMAAPASSNNPASPQEQTRPNAESYFMDGLACLKKTDIACAQVALANIPSNSPYAKLLAGNIAASTQDYNQTFILLLPLQADKTLSPTANASLHASLALAYDNQTDGSRALQERLLAERYLTNEDDIRALQTTSWQALTRISKDILVDMRGDSVNTTMQGWIDLAIVIKSPTLNAQAIKSWQVAYPDHPAIAFIAQPLLEQLASKEAPVNTPETATSGNHIALILPYLVESFYAASDAIERGFMAAQATQKDTAEVKIYASNGAPDEIATIYQRAVNEGAQLIVGPLTRDEVTALAQGKIDIPTLALNNPDGIPPTPNLYTYGLSIDNEAQQIVRIARGLGMQSATIVMVDGPLENRMAKTFSEAWVADGGQIKLQIAVTPTSDLGTIKTDISNTPSDMIFMAANADGARILRPYLDPATPTFGLSHIFGGILQNPDDVPLTAIRFVDMPWLLEDSSTAVTAYETESANLPPGEMQRWFALGVDAYKLLTIIAQHPNQAASFTGLTGKIRLNTSGEISRELALASFGKNGVILEKLP
ncbi:MAG: penicillin-binding protein activator [Methylophilaceae bacterium]